jgi:hypothetical protein
VRHPRCRGVSFFAPEPQAPRRRLGGGHDRGVVRRRLRPGGRPLPIKGGCVLTLDRSIGDFEVADVLIQGKTT